MISRTTILINTLWTVILGQSCTSRGRKSNTGIPSADPYNFDVDVPSKRNRQLLQDISDEIKKKQQYLHLIMQKA